MDFSGTSGAQGRAHDFFGLEEGRRALARWLIGTLVLLSGAVQAQPSRLEQAPPPAAACPALLNHTFPRLQDEKPQALCQYAGKALLIVNTASFCGFTPQYAGLEAMSARYGAQGFAVLGFPSNDFSQEGGSNKEIAAFCENTFNVKFPMFAKSRVSGSQAHPLFKQLAAASGSLPRWNFHKYVVSRDGRTVTSFDSSVDPADPRLRRTIENSLLAK